jgi:hypothetical protein
MNKQKLPYIFVIIAIFLFFFTEKKLVPSVFYTFLAAGLAFYFWPVKMILELVKNKNAGLKKIIVAIVSNFLYSAVLCMSAVWLYYPDGSFWQTASSIIGLANAVTGLVYYLFSIDDEKAIVHFMLNSLPCIAQF